MAAFPSYACIQFSDYSESFDPSVERTEMERGMPKQRRINSRVLVTVNALIIFKTKADSIAFESWYFDTIGRIGFFDVTHPRYGLKSMRFQSGNIGDLVPLTSDFSVSQRVVTLEYLR